MATASHEPYPDVDLSGLRRFSREEFRRLTEGNILEPDRPLAWRDGLVWLADADGADARPVHREGRFLDGDDRPPRPQRTAGTDRRENP